MKQDHTEETIRHTDGEQNTGNHKEPSAPDASGADKFGGTRAGAANVEPAGSTGAHPATKVEATKAPVKDDQGSGLDT